MRLRGRPGKPSQEGDEIGVLVRRLLWSLSVVAETGDIHGLVVPAPGRTPRPVAPQAGFGLLRPPEGSCEPCRRLEKTTPEVGKCEMIAGDAPISRLVVGQARLAPRAPCRGSWPPRRGDEQCRGWHGDLVGVWRRGRCRSRYRRSSAVLAVALSRFRASGTPEARSAGPPGGERRPSRRLRADDRGDAGRALRGRPRDVPARDGCLPRRELPSPLARGSRGRPTSRRLTPQVAPSRSKRHGIRARARAERHS